jgi:hypothetical protein
MKSLFIKGTAKTPRVHFDMDTGNLEITGRSIPENSLEFYRVLVEWLREYAKEVKDKINLRIHLDHFNSSTAKVLLDVFKKLEKIHKEKQNVSIQWVYESGDENIIESGNDYQSIIQIPFQIIEVK